MTRATTSKSNWTAY